MSVYAENEAIAPISKTATSSPAEMIRIVPQEGWLKVNWREIWRYRELLYFLTWRDIKIRYKQTFLGAAWAVLQPMLSMVVFWVFLGKLAKVPSEGMPYPIFIYAGLLPWMFFSNIVNTSSMSLLGNERLVSKVYFPRLIIPTSSVGVAFVDLIVAMGMLVVMMGYYHLWPNATILLIPFLIVIMTAAALGVGLFLCALNIEYRDFKYVVPFFLQLWMFATPVVYPASLVPEAYRKYIAINPMAGLIEGFRASLLGKPLSWELLMISSLMSLAMFCVGLRVFRRMEYKFADLI
jgi:lipopolysaccharide transport system permease protein